MKTVNVTVTIQMDILGEDILSEVIDGVEIMNNLIASNVLEFQPQIFVSDIDTTNIIILPQLGFEIGEEVEVPDPDDTDIHNHSFVGTIVDFRNGYAVVDDGDCNCFDIELDRLTKID
jgi:hypothetical protein